MIYKQIRNTKERQLHSLLPISPIDKNELLSPSSKGKFIWSGHSVLLMQMESKIIAIDPMMGSDTTPIAPISTKRFSAHILELIDDFTELDLMLIKHDHYDHLNFSSIQKLKNKT
jgi:L-ascorbate metabolism protein UlaG (beta-lactamase superfamily)